MKKNYTDLQLFYESSVQEMYHPDMHMYHTILGEYFVLYIVLSTVDMAVAVPTHFSTLGLH